MKVYRVNEIFYSLQGEGRNTGRAAMFIRFAGCNLRCAFCDTEFDSYTEMTAEEIISQISSLRPQASNFIVLTGGEPTLQVDEAFVDLLHQHGYEVAMESNGIRPAPKNLDWLTVSPKVLGDGCLVSGNGRFPNELKIVFDENTVPEAYLPTLAPHHPTPLLYLQPCDTGDPERNKAIIAQCVDYIKKHPEWCLSLQTHKLIDIK